MNGGGANTASPHFRNFYNLYYEAISLQIIKEDMRMMKYAGDAKKLFLVGAGALIAYAQFGPVGVVAFGVVLVLASK